MVKLTKFGHQIEKSCGDVYVVAQLSCFVIPGEDMMIVMPSFAKSNTRHQFAVHRAYVLIVGTHAIEMSGTVHQPSSV